MKHDLMLEYPGEHEAVSDLHSKYLHRYNPLYSLFICEDNNLYLFVQIEIEDEQDFVYLKLSMKISNAPVPANLNTYYKYLRPFDRFIPALYE